LEQLIERAKILIEALPYIKAFSGQTIVIKLGGRAGEDDALRRSFAKDIVLLKYVGVRPVVVHGGGPQITQVMERMGKQASFSSGQRITDEETRDIAEMVLAGRINKQLVSLINEQGGNAVGLSGVDGNLIEAERADKTLGMVGRIKKINPAVIDVIDREQFIPVIAPLGIGGDGLRYNINADLCAGAIAGALAAYKLIFLTDTPGILREPSNEESLISSLPKSKIRTLISNGIIKGGMLPKITSCDTALSQGVGKCHIIDGRIPHGILLELFTDQGIGTQITQE
jgi:acetylglutamate kinase